MRPERAPLVCVLFAGCCGVAACTPLRGSADVLALFAAGQDRAVEARCAAEWQRQEAALTPAERERIAEAERRFDALLQAEDPVVGPDEALALPDDPGLDGAGGGGLPALTAARPGGALRQLHDDILSASPTRALRAVHELAELRLRRVVPACVVRLFEPYDLQPEASGAFGGIEAATLGRLLRRRCAAAVAQALQGEP